MEELKLFPVGLMARRLRVPVRWLRAEAEAGRLPHVKADGAILFDPKVVERLLLERATGSEMFVSPRRAARLLGVPEAFLRRQVVHGLIPHLKDGQKILLNIEAVRGALLNHSAKNHGAKR